MLEMNVEDSKKESLRGRSPRSPRSSGTSIAPIPCTRASAEKKASKLDVLETLSRSAGAEGRRELSQVLQGAVLAELEALKTAS